jgi:hypothetical protein
VYVCTKPTEVVAKVAVKVVVKARKLCSWQTLRPGQLNAFSSFHIPSLAFGYLDP